jgi:hypothetical protein
MAAANQSLNMSAEMWRAWRTPNDVDSFVSTGAYERLAAKVGAIVGVEIFGQSSNRPIVVDFLFAEPCAFVENGVQETKADR